MWYIVAHKPSNSETHLQFTLNDKNVPKIASIHMTSGNIIRLQGVREARDHFIEQYPLSTQNMSDQQPDNDNDPEPDQLA